MEQVMIIMAGDWELRVELARGGTADRVVFPFQVAEAKEAPAPAPEKERPAYSRISANYRVPNVTLLNQDGRQVKLRELLEGDKPVVLNFIFTSCTTICPVLSASMTSLRKELGAEASRVQFVSVSLDPEYDRPEVLKAYQARFGSSAGWEMLTGTREDIGRVLKAFDAFVTDKMAHEPLFLLKGSDSESWVRIKGLIKKSELLDEYRKVTKR